MGLEVDNWIWVLKVTLAYILRFDLTVEGRTNFAIQLDFEIWLRAKIEFGSLNLHEFCNLIWELRFDLWVASL